MDRKPEILIEKGIPLSLRQGGSQQKLRKYPFPAMEIGDSFYAPLSMYEPRDGVARMSKFKASLSRIAVTNKEHGRFSLRSDENGIRVWRVA